MSDDELLLDAAARSPATPRVLIIAGSDSGGGAGIQADIKTVTMLGGHAMTAITAITAQNTLGVQAVQAIPPSMLLAQVRSVADDIGVDAIKIGMLPDADSAIAVAAILETQLRDQPVVLDPVMVATSGDRLAAGDVGTVIIERLAPRATLVTPNLPELEALGGEAALRATGAAVLVKGGHAPGPIIVDRLIDRDGHELAWADTRIETPHTHGTGCTLASAIATGLAMGWALDESVTLGRAFVRAALHAAPGLGRGHGPMGHQAVRLDLESLRRERAGEAGGITATTRR